MGLLNLRKKSTGTNYPEDNAFFRQLFSWLNGNFRIGGGVSENAQSYIEDGFTGNIDVFSIINKINRMATQANPELVLIKGDKEEIITNADFNELLMFPNPGMPFDEFQSGYLTYLNATGNSYIYNLLGPGSKLCREMHIMPAQKVEVVQGNWLDPILGYKLIEGKEQTPFTKDEVIHARFFNPLVDDNHKFYGLSPLKAAARTINKNTEAEKLQLTQFENQAPKGIIMPKSINGNMATWDKEQKENRKKWLRKFGADKKDTVYVAGEELSYINLGISAGDLKAIESSVDGLRKLCGVYGMPSQLFGDPAASTYNNVIEMKKDAWNNGIKPLLDTFAKHLTINARRENPNFKVRFDYSEIPELQEDLAQKVVWMKQAYWTPNEIREATGLDRIENENMDQPYFTISDIPLNDLGIDLNNNEPS